MNKNTVKNFRHLLLFALPLFSVFIAACETETPTDATTLLAARDRDDDGIVDALDNCPGAFNQEQANFDNDAWGDACDEDDDNDAIRDTVDICPYLPMQSDDDE